MRLVPWAFIVTVVYANCWAWVFHVLSAPIWLQGQAHSAFTVWFLGEYWGMFPLLTWRSISFSTVLWAEWLPACHLWGSVPFTGAIPLGLCPSHWQHFWKLEKAYLSPCSFKCRQANAVAISSNGSQQNRCCSECWTIIKRRGLWLKDVFSMGNCSPLGLFGLLREFWATMSL